MIPLLRRAGALLALALLLGAPAEAGGRKLEKKAEKAAEAADAGDVRKAISLGLEVLEEDPDNLDAAWAVGSSMATLLLAGSVPAEDEAELRRGTLLLLEAAGADPVHLVRAATARRLHAQLGGQRYVLPRPEPACPPEAVADFDRAEVAFGQGRMVEARGHYTAAIAACPTNPTWIVFLGDTWMEEDRAQALAAYDRALVLDPCHPQAHRFAADLLMRASAPEELERGVRHGLAAVACDPTYEEAWVTLNGVLQSRGQRAVIRVEPSADAEGWSRYQAELARTPGEDPLARREAAIRAVLREGPPETPLWQAITAASGKGWLEEAILFELLDAELGPVFLAERAGRLERMRAYVELFHTVP